MTRAQCVQIHLKINKGKSKRSYHPTAPQNWYKSVELFHISSHVSRQVVTWSTVVSKESFESNEKHIVSINVLFLYSFFILFVI